MKQQSVSETIAQACSLRPVLKPVLETFGPLMAQRLATAERLAPLLAEAGIKLSGIPETAPLLPATLPGGLASFIRQAASDLLPLINAQEPFAPYKCFLDELFMKPANEADLEFLLEVILGDNPDAFIGLAKKHKLEPQILEFVAEFVCSAVLRALALPRHAGRFPEWRKGICPVCGTPPVIAWLDRKTPAECNEFLTDGGGKKYLHCGMCGTDWYFLRGVCPACGKQGQDAMQIMGEEDRRHERIDWCKACHSYLPQVDLREMAETPDMDAMALGLMHLDIHAAERELMPLKPSFWNMF